MSSEHDLWHLLHLTPGDMRFFFKFFAHAVVRSWETVKMSGEHDL